MRLALCFGSTGCLTNQTLLLCPLCCSCCCCFHLGHACTLCCLPGQSLFLRPLRRLPYQTLLLCLFRRCGSFLLCLSCCLRCLLSQTFLHCLLRRCLLRSPSCCCRR